MVLSKLVTLRNRNFRNLNQNPILVLADAGATSARCSKKFEISFI